MNCKQLFDKFLSSSKDNNISFNIQKSEYGENSYDGTLFDIFYSQYKINGKIVSCNLEKLVKIRKLAKKENIKHISEKYVIVEGKDECTIVTNDKFFKK